MRLCQISLQAHGTKYPSFADTREGSDLAYHVPHRTDKCGIDTSNEQDRHLYFLDRLKVVLIMIVIAHHACLPWAGGNWWPVECEQHTAWLHRFLAVNYTFFMGLFFMISAYFHPGSIDRHGPFGFVRKRLLRLGIPLVTYLACIVPLIMYAYYIRFRDHGYMPFWQYYIEMYWGFNPGPLPGWTGPTEPDRQLLQLWFTEHLLIYGLLYAFWRLTTKRFKLIKAPPRRSETTLKPLHAHLSILGYALVLAIAYFIVRIRYPIYEWIGLFDYVQVEFARLPLYATVFIIGLVAYRRNWLMRLPKNVGYVWAAIGVALSLAVYTGAMDNCVLFTPGGTSARALRYAVLEAFLGSSICVGLIVLFREKFNSPAKKFGRMLSANVYCVYVIHVPLVVIIQHVLIQSTLPGSVLSVITVLVSIPLTFAVSHCLVRRLPGARAIL